MSSEAISRFARSHVRRATSGWQPSTNLRGDVDQARELISGAAGVVVLTGAGTVSYTHLPWRGLPTPVPSRP